ncbi:hypothetical protein [Streptococcus oralis]|uniref:Uncharacterized protein n=2 Tax=Streptococcus oralis subsp. tigurinus TaxID=1077464 RepID=S9RC82_STROR|nr:hypothetical protein [Streptococcus oralis]EMG35343.1 hypothetical protein H353_02330 [Streptococcus oralis subsp. tigurinus 1366]EPX89978.1 hypothetical protein L697_01420 [Streptococcus oralis subsp. tigurinus 2425]EPX91316.1 hypothetical protein L698_02235 [Streptococcus oralis subsp. tigurinus 2426]ORJ31493.1 hypothetical protein ATE37_01675 [Streptococcus oralis subsp. tigurinus]
MAVLQLHRKLSFVNDRGLLYLIVDDVNQGRVTAIVDKQIELSAGKHSLYIKDILGFTSQTLLLDIKENDNVSVTVGNAPSFIVLVVLLLILSILFKTMPFTAGLPLVNWGLPILWIIFLLYLVVFRRHNLYDISK